MGSSEGESQFSTNFNLIDCEQSCNWYNKIEDWVWIFIIIIIVKLSHMATLADLTAHCKTGVSPSHQNEN